MKRIVTIEEILNNLVGKFVKIVLFEKHLENDRDECFFGYLLSYNKKQQNIIIQLKLGFLKVDIERIKQIKEVQCKWGK